MRAVRPSLLAALLAGGIFFGAWAPVLAHDLSILTETAKPAIIVRASYGGAEPVARADVEVYSPAQPDSAYQIGSTDLSGAFAFVPPVAGKWLVVVDDGLGHRQQVEVAVDWSAPPADRSNSSSWRNLAIGVALLFGAAGFWYGMKARDDPAVHAEVRKD